MSMIEIQTVKKRFVDIDLSLTLHPISKDISKKVNESAIIASIKNLVMTRMYGRQFHPELSSQVHSLLFEQLTPSNAAILERVIRYVIENFEPRVQIEVIKVSEQDEHTLRVDLIFSIVGLLNTIKTQFFLQRIL